MRLMALNNKDKMTCLSRGRSHFFQFFFTCALLLLPANSAGKVAPLPALRASLVALIAVCPLQKMSNSPLAP